MRLIDIEDEALLAELRGKQDACKEMIDNATDDDPTWTEREHWEGVYGSFVEMALFLKAQPTVDAELVKHGRWLKGGYVCGETEWICSICGKTEWRTNCNRMKYCMFCGAKMDLKEVDDAAD